MIDDADSDSDENVTSCKQMNIAIIPQTNMEFTQNYVLSEQKAKFQNNFDSTTMNENNSVSSSTRTTSTHESGTDCCHSIFSAPTQATIFSSFGASEEQKCVISDI